MFLARLLAILGQVSAAKQAVLLGVTQGESGEDVRPLLVWPAGVDQGGTQVAPVASDDDVQRRLDVLSAARAAAESRQTRVFGFDADDQMYDAGQKGYMIGVCVPTPEDEPIRHVVTMLIEQRTQQALQTTLALVEVIAGYTHHHAAAQALRQLRASSVALDLAARLIAAINHAPRFKGACLQLVNDLSRQLHLDRVALGWVKGLGEESGVVRCIAMSDTEDLDRRMELVRRLETAMDECLDQQQAVLHPSPPEKGDGADVLLSQAITHAHRELASGDARLRVASVPLRIGDRVVGVLTVESADEASPLSAEVVEWLQSSMDLVTPVLEVRRSDDRALPVRAMVSARRAGAWVVGPRHTLWKLAGLVVIALAIAVTFVQVPYRIEAPFELMARQQRVISAPYDGVIERLGEGIRKGERVTQGQVLAEMRTTELRLAMHQAMSQRLQAQTKLDDALQSGKAGDAELARTEVAAADAQIDLLNHRIEHASLRSPIDGVIVDGDLENRIGSTVQLGDALFVVARLDDLVAVAKVDDRDVSYVREGAHGALARKSDPAERIPIEVERIVPMAMPESGHNAFEVRAAIALDRVDQERAAAVVASLRPGMEGLVKIDTGDRTIAWILSRRIRDAVRLWMWW